MCPVQFASTRKYLDSASSATSASGVALCTRANVRCYCCSKRVLRSLFNRLTMGMANYTSRSQSRPSNWRTGNRGSKQKELLSKKKKRGSWEVGAFTFETRTDICWNWRHPALGPSTDRTPSKMYGFPVNQDLAKTRYDCRFHVNPEWSFSGF